MGHHERKAYLQAILKRYRKANKFEKAQILNEFCSVCAYNPNGPFHFSRQRSLS